MEKDNHSAVATILVIMLLILLPSLGVFSLDNSMSFNFVLAVDGGNHTRKAVGDEIGVQLELKRTDEDNSYPMYSMQSQLIFDGRYFELIEDSLELADGIICTRSNMEDGIRKKITLSQLNMNPDGIETPSSFEVVSFRLRALATVEDTDITNRNFKVNTRSGDTYLATGNDVSVTLSGLSPACHSLSFVEGEDFNAMPTGYQLLVLETSQKLEGYTYVWRGEPLLYSPQYGNPDTGPQVFLHAIKEALTPVDALAEIQVDLGDPIVLNYINDVNADGRVNSTDAVLVYGLYKGLHAADSEFARVSLRMRLEADVNGDWKVDIDDAMAILYHCWGR